MSDDIILPPEARLDPRRDEVSMQGPKGMLQDADDRQRPRRPGVVPRLPRSDLRRPARGMGLVLSAAFADRDQVQNVAVLRERCYRVREYFAKKEAST
jgi:hypothetical protein